MNDKELLMMAAKAAGVEINGWFEDDDRMFADISEAGVIEWNPLVDDGDALRLAVKMRLKVDIRAVCVTVEPYIFNQNAESTFEFFADDENLRPAATRRTIVRAAAEIGRKL